MYKLFAILALVAATSAHAGNFAVTVTTTPVSGTAGFIAFDMLGGAPLQGNTLVVSAFTTNGSIGTGAGSGSFSGSLAGSLTLNSATNFFNEWLQPVVFGTRLSFNFALSEQYTSGTPDNFSFYLLNSTGQPLGSTDPTGSGAAFSADIRATTVPAVFTSPSFAVSLVPEPQSWLLWATALACGAALRRAPRR